MRFKTIVWDARDVKTPEGPKFEVFAFAQAPDRSPVTIQIVDAEPWIHAVLPSDIREAEVEVAAKAIFKTLVKKLEREDHSPTKYETAFRLPYYYYTDKEEACMKIHFKTEEAAKHCHNLLNRWPIYINRVPYKLQPVEANIDQLTKFQAEYELKHCTWIEIPEGTPQVPAHEKRSPNRFEYRISKNDFVKLSPMEAEKMPTIRPSYVVFDDEMFSKRKYAFPDPLNSEDVVFMTGMLHAVFDNEKDDYEVREYAVVYHMTLKDKDIRPIPYSKLVRHGPTKYEIVEDPTKNVKMIFLEDEIDLIDTVEQLMIELNPDCVLGHNSNGFDFPYQKIRKGRLMAPYKNLSRLFDTAPGFDTIKWSSSAYRDIELEIPTGPGRIYFDTLLLAKRSVVKEDTYGLDAMCQQYMGIGKHDHSPQKIFESFAQNDPEKLRDTIVYCMRDVWCTWGLFQHMGYWFSYEGLSDVIGISIFDLFARGQGKRTQPQVFRECYKRGYYLFSPERVPKTIAGGYVFPQKPELVEYMVLLDFEGLYPSVMDYYNISNDTNDHFNRASDDMTNVFEWTDDHGHWKTRFVKRDLRDGIVPQILRGLRAKRKMYKEKMAECKKNGDMVGAMIYNALQDATKVSMNSVYGALAQAGGKLGLEDAGATVTALGRMLVKKMAAYVESKGWRVVYGDTDSVMIARNTPLTDDEKRNFDKLATEFLVQLNKDLFTGMAPINVALDGLFRSYFTIAPKMYCFVKWDPKDPLGVNPELWSSKGVASAKRDSCKMNRRLYKKLAVMITCMKPFEDVMEALLEEIRRLLYGKLELEEMITIQGLTGEYKKQNYPMAVYYRHLQEIGLAPKPGDRVPYVLRLLPGKTLKHAGSYFEDPDVFQREGYEFARHQYLKSQFSGRLDKMLNSAYPHLCPKQNEAGKGGLLYKVLETYKTNPKGFDLDVAVLNIIEKWSAEYEKMQSK
jgi:DNA polymerase elongation subunit (family B)